MNSDYAIFVLDLSHCSVIISVFTMESILKIGVIICWRTNVVLAGYKL